MPPTPPAFLYTVAPALGFLIPLVLLPEDRVDEDWKTLQPLIHQYGELEYWIALMAGSVGAIGLAISPYESSGLVQLLSNFLVGASVGTLTSSALRVGFDD